MSSAFNESDHAITIVAHRGLHDFYPENSLNAFDVARAAGFDWVEFDVWASSDGLPVIMHDESLDRTAEATGRIEEKHSTELSRVRLRGPREDLRNCFVPIGLPSSSGGMLIEVKPLNAKNLIETIVDSMRLRKTPWILQSFDSANLIQAWSICPDLSVAWLIDTNANLETALRERWPAVHVQHDLLTGQNVAALRAAGMRVGAWTVNEEQDIQRIVLLRPDYIISDVPRRVRRIIESSGLW